MNVEILINFSAKILINFKTRKIVVFQFFNVYLNIEIKSVSVVSKTSQWKIYWYKACQGRNKNIAVPNSTT